MWKNLWLALLCLSSSFAWAADPWCGKEEKQAFVFKWLPDGDLASKMGTIRISNAAGRTHQILPKVKRYYTTADDLDFRDFNNDGCGDLTVVNDVAAIGNESKTVYLYQKASRRFIRHAGLSGIGGVDIDPRDRNCVTSFWKGGAADLGTSRHCWRKGKLVLLKEYSVSPLINEEGELACYQHTTTTYRNGRKKTKVDCTKEF